MDSQGPNNTYSSGRVPGQAQMRREWDDMLNPPSDLHNQGQSTLLQETGTQVKNMAQGAADVSKSAAQGAVNLARGAANVAVGTAEAVKNTLGLNNPNDSTTTRSSPRSSYNKNTTTMGFNNTSGTTITPNLMDTNIDMEGLNYPGNADTIYPNANLNDMGDSNYPRNTMNTNLGSDSTYPRDNINTNLGDSTYPRDTNYSPSNRNNRI